MTRDAGLRILLAVLAAAGALWLVTATEWADTEVNEPPRGEAARNKFYAAQGLLRKIGAQVVKRPNLDAMPPREARLVLASRHWDLFPDRPARLKQWVEAGGHLVVPVALIDHKQLAWLPVRTAKLPPSSDDESARERRPTPSEPRDLWCRELVEPSDLQPSYAGMHAVRVCASPHWRALQAAPGHEPSWQMASARGTELLRVPVGRGSVTVLGPRGLLDNDDVLRAGAPLAAAAALQARRGAEVWFVVEEARDPLLGWLWSEAWPAILTALAALAFALWRGAVRFGPVAGSAGNHRRSMAEQITGTSHFLKRHGAAALHAAQVRALHEAARRRVRGGHRLQAGDIATAVAQATGLRSEELARAMAARPRTSGELSADLELLEIARRRLAAPPSTVTDASP